MNTIILILLFSVIFVDISSGSLVFVNVLFRHGNRTIEFIYPTDPYKDITFWPEGYGQLTEAGIVAEHELGEWLRSRYSDLLPTQYSAEDIQVRSTNKNRTIMSAKACLAGMYNTSEEIPIELEKGSVEVFYEIEPCPRYDHLRKEYETKDPWYLKIKEDNKDLINQIANFSGIELKEFDDVSDVYSTLLVESISGLKLPDWTESMFPEPMQSIAAYGFYNDFYTDEIERLKIGSFVGQLLQNMEDKSKMMSKKKMMVYSGHDITVVDLLHAMRLYDDLVPPYCATLLIELHQVDNQHFVKVLYRNTTSEEPFVLTLPDCPELCPLPTFRKILLPLVPIDINSECQLHQLTQANQTSGGTSTHQSFVDAFVVVTCYILCVATCQMLLLN